MTSRFNVLVTGCGGDIGQSIGKILNDVDLVDTLYGMDISDRNAGRFIFSNFSVGLPCLDPNYLSSLNSFIKDKQIDLLIPVSEQELRFFSANGITGELGQARLLMASNAAMDIGFDKLKTASFLRENNLPYPHSCPVAEATQLDRFPVVLKSRAGSGSSQVHVVKDRETFDFIKSRHPEYIVQEHLHGENGEFTCGLFRSSKNETRTIIFKRELSGGYSGYGEVVANEQIDRLLISIAEAIDLTGSINVQLRLTDRGPVVFEINPRFSSTVLFRHMFGFHDLTWSIEDVMGIDISPNHTNAVGRKFYKGYSKYISNQDPV